MNHRIATVVAAATLAALPLVAAEKAKPKEPATPAAAVAPAPAPVKDSPLVAAARRTKRLGKKPTNVITNDTIKKSGATAHISAPDHPMAPLPVYSPAVPAEQEPSEAKAAEQRMAAEATAKAKQNQEANKRRMAAEGEEQGQYADPDQDESQKPPHF